AWSSSAARSASRPSLSPTEPRRSRNERQPRRPLCRALHRPGRRRRRLARSGGLGAGDLALAGRDAGRNPGHAVLLQLERACRVLRPDRRDPAGRPFGRLSSPADPRQLREPAVAGLPDDVAGNLGGHERSAGHDRRPRPARLGPAAGWLSPLPLQPRGLLDRLRLEPARPAGPRYAAAPGDTAPHRAGPLLPVPGAHLDVAAGSGRAGSVRARRLVVAAMGCGGADLRVRDRPLVRRAAGPSDGSAELAGRDLGRPGPRRALGGDPDHGGGLAQQPPRLARLGPHRPLSRPGRLGLRADPPAGAAWSGVERPNAGDLARAAGAGAGLGPRRPDRLPHRQGLAHLAHVMDAHRFHAAAAPC
ncbi:conserved hypothetical protein, partial [Ricinus communis]